MSGRQETSPLKIGDVLAGKKPTTRSVVIDLDDGEKVTFTFRSIGRVAMRDLLDAHKPTPDQRRELREAQKLVGIPSHRRAELPFNSDTYPPALIAACCVSPAMTEDEATELWESEAWGEGELMSLFEAAQLVNSQKARPPDPEA